MGKTAFKRFSFLFSSQHPQDILMVGLDSVGKTTILYILQNNQEMVTVPTIGFNLEEVKINKTMLRVFDMGGQDRIRHLWSSYVNTTNGIVYVFDIEHPQRYQEAVDQLYKITSTKDVPVLILVNKIDTIKDSNELEEKKKAIVELINSVMQKKLFNIKFITAKVGPDTPKEDIVLPLEEAFMWLTTQIKGS